METRQRGLHYILGGSFMIVVGVMSTVAFGNPGYFAGAPLWFLGLFTIGYGVWLRR